MNGKRTIIRVHFGHYVIQYGAVEGLYETTTVNLKSSACEPDGFAIERGDAVWVKHLGIAETLETIHVWGADVLRQENVSQRKDKHALFDFDAFEQRCPNRQILKTCGIRYTGKIPIGVIFP